MIFKGQGDTLLKIIDFGFAKVTKKEVERGLTFLGTPWYMSPEVISKKLYSKACDVWAIGVIM